MRSPTRLPASRGMLGVLFTCVLLAGVASCSDSGATRATAPGVDLRGPRFVRTDGTLTAAGLDAQIGELIAKLFPNGLETAAGTRWTSIKSKVALGANDPAQLAEAKSKLAELVKWIIGKQTAMSVPPGESVQVETAKLVAYMSSYVYGVAVPPIPQGVDAGVGLVLPDGQDPAPIVTAEKFAGVDLKALSVAVPTVITIVENPTPQTAACAGPLDTTLCQFPRFYKFDAYPHVRLAKPAVFVVCHTKTGNFPWADEAFDRRLRLAHDKPASPANYSEGSTIYEGIEILKLVTVPSAFVDCDGPAESHTATASVLRQRLGALASAAWAFVGPKTAYAIDLGGGGEASFFSNFNVVDPQLTRSVTFSGITMSACNALVFGYTVDGVPVDVHAKQDDCRGVGAPGPISRSYADVTVQVAPNAVVKAYLRDLQCQVTFTQDGSHALVTGTNPYQVAINDAGFVCESRSTASVPTGSGGNLRLTITDATVTSAVAPR